MAVTAAQTKAALNLILAFTESIREAGEIPSGTLYAAAMSKGCDYQTYERAITLIKNTGLVTETPAHLLRWTGPLAKAVA